MECNCCTGLKGGVTGGVEQRGARSGEQCKRGRVHMLEGRLGA